MTSGQQDDAAGRVAAYFDPGGFPGFTIDANTAWTSEQVKALLDHHRAFLRQSIEPDLRDVLRQLDDAKAESQRLTGEATQAQAQSHADLQSAIKYNEQREKAGQVTVKAWDLLTQAELDRDHARGIVRQLAAAIQAYVPDPMARAFHLASLPDWAKPEERK